MSDDAKKFAQLASPSASATVDLPLNPGSVARFDWKYISASESIERLAKQARELAWDPVTAVDWTIEVEFGSPNPGRFGAGLAHKHAPRRDFSDVKTQFQWHLQAWMLSQFLHGEQGALIAAARIVEAAPTIEHKEFAATQALDEARHVAVFRRYIHEKLQVAYPVDGELERLMYEVVSDHRWDMVFLGMQVMLEGVALGTFALARQILFEPLARSLLDLVLRDEARHVAFGLVSLRDPYAGLSAHDRQERIDFVHHAIELLAARFEMRELWERVEVPARTREAISNDPFVGLLRRRSFSRLRPILRGLGLWDEGIDAALRGVS